MKKKKKKVNSRKGLNEKPETQASLNPTQNSKFKLNSSPNITKKSREKMNKDSNFNTSHLGCTDLGTQGQPITNIYIQGYKQQ